MSASLGYRPEIDGLRAVAVIPVILFHAGYALFGGGFVGVDVFFVISGYLITAILIAELEGGRFSLGGFYERRARRILPALAVVVLACIPVAWTIMLPWQFEDFARSVVAVSLFSSNVLFWRESGYFAAAAEEKPLLHTWSLAVEEQYYVLFPIFLVLAWRFGRRRVFWAVAGIAAASLALNEWALRHPQISGPAVFYLTPFRGWELLVGSICAFLTHGRAQRSSQLLSMAGLAMILVATFAYDETVPFPSVYAVLPVLGTALIILYADGRTWTGRLLSTRPFLWIGLISYSAYLWHQPLFAFARIQVAGGPGPWLMAALSVLSLVLAALSLRYVEQPFRDRRRFSRRGVLGVSAAGLVLFGALGAVTVQRAGFETLWMARQTPEQRAAYTLVTSVQDDFGAEGGRSYDNGVCRFNLPRLDADSAARIVACTRRHGPGIAVLGDSHAHDLFGVVAAGSDAPFLVGLTQGGCRAFEDRPGCPYEGMLALVRAHPDAFSNVIYEQAGFYLLRTPRRPGDRGLMADHPLDAPMGDVFPDAERIADVRRYLAELAAEVPVLWFGPRLEPHLSDNDIVRLGCRSEFGLRPGQQAVMDRLDAVLAEAVREVGNLSYLSQNATFDYRFPEDLMSCAEIYWADGDHLSAAGERRFGARYDLVGHVRGEAGREISPEVGRRAAPDGSLPALRQATQ